MGLINWMLGNASEVDPEELQREFGQILFEGEKIDAAFRIIRDKWIFTDHRLIMLNVQGVTGSKREYLSIPYQSITQFCVETPGTLDDDCEMKIWVKGQTAPYQKAFSRRTNIRGIQQTLAEHIFRN